ncbi:MULTISPECIES: Crp/Fnr family transcriptional regulator [unclassified Flavobacterium]|jgi:CRP-like cAMP-binding protein|uniref:Crp/Fnr family transcriptional regulator n=1 Tax=unclassified Flavobacterium TaxID=196869 RepID=UPI0005800E7A|nr:MULTISPECIES: Crp/Fnr family transcriptional regulator [unclassified Flavobacterium]KIA93067.1 Crp/Fnr family transcriptional regulator [Flavobacterium sp. KMS]MEA9415821.1 Crp/Fnr family transcriptional regulator [Flavobacterium sp. PL02]OUL60078.1 Crp/Fnr family transcriptional regulator [Flavobacterium sp. AJR]
MKDFFAKFDFQSNQLFENLTESEKQAVESVMEPLNIKKGSMLFYEGGIPTGIYQIKNGKSKKFKRGFTGDEQIFYIYTSDDVLGYHALLGQERYQDSCEALEDLKVNFIAKDDFLKLLQEIPALQQKVIKNISHEFGVLANIITVLAQKNQNARLALFLLLLENRFNRNSLTVKGIDLTRDDLANLIGTSQESLGRSLKQFKEQGAIIIDKRNIYIKDREQLEQLLQVKIE